MSNGATYQGNCFCGAVQFTVSGEPVAMGYCHCQSCREWSAKDLPKEFGGSGGTLAD